MTLVARRTSERSNGPDPSADLLPSDGVSAPVRPPTPARALAAEALRLIRVLSSAGVLPAGWRSPTFVREVALVRAHLAPLRSRAALAASFSSEAFHTAPANPVMDDPSAAVRVAYAMRWLELGGDRAIGAWPTMPSDVRSPRQTPPDAEGASA